MKEPVFVAVAWPYVNGNLHIGHVAGNLLPADITARFFRLLGHPVLMASGSDCFGTPITVEADKRGVNPEEIVNEYHPKNVELFEKLQMSYDIYTKTTTENHRKITQEFLLAFHKRNLLEIKTEPQYFSKTQNKFLPDRYVEGKCPICGFLEARSDQCDNCGSLLNQNLIDPVSKIDKKSVELRDTGHLFISWNKLQKQIETFEQSKKVGWRKWVVAETEKWFTEGLRARAVTRDLDWGVEIPEEIAAGLEGAHNKRIYVWFDAVIGYYSASREWADRENKDWEVFWKNKDAKHYYFMGKDNLIFHTIFWPGQLMTYDTELNLPDFPAINQYLNLEGAKFSKSRGVIIDTREFIEKFGSDSLRFYLTTIMPESDDANFVWDDFFRKNNDLLVGHLGNYIHRTLSLYKGTQIDLHVDDTVVSQIEAALTRSIDFLKKSEFKSYLHQVEALAQFANAYFNRRKPWITKKESELEFKTDSGSLVILTYALAALLEPITPEASQKYFKSVGLAKNDFWQNSDSMKEHLCEILKEISISEIEPLYSKHLTEESE